MEGGRELMERVAEPPEQGGGHGHRQGSAEGPTWQREWAGRLCVIHDVGG